MKKVCFYFAAAASSAALVLSGGCTDINGEGNENGEGGVPPGTVAGKLLKSVMIEEPDSEPITVDIEYGDDGRVSLITMDYDLESDTDEDLDRYEFIWQDASLTAHIYLGDGYSPQTYECVYRLDGQGRVISSDSTAGDYPDHDEYSYNADGYLTGWSCSVEDYSAEYKWADGNLVADVPSRGAGTKFRYSDYDNNANLDLNFLFTGGYGILDSMPVFLGLTGNRSAKLAIPFIWDESEDPSPAMGAITEDMVQKPYIYKETKTIYDSEASTAEYVFDNDGTLLKVTGKRPVYEVEYERTTTYRINDYNKYEIDGSGVKWYFDFDTDVSERELGRKHVDDEIMTFTMSWYPGMS